MANEYTVSVEDLTRDPVILEMAREIPPHHLEVENFGLMVTTNSTYYRRSQRVPAHSGAVVEALRIVQAEIAEVEAGLKRDNEKDTL